MLWNVETISCHLEEIGFLLVPMSFSTGLYKNAALKNKTVRARTNISWFDWKVDMDKKWPQFFFRSIFDPTHQCNRRLLIFVSVPLLKLQYHLTEKDHQEASLHVSPKLLVPSYVPLFVWFVFLLEKSILIPTYVILISSRCCHRHLLIFHQHDPPP